MGQISVEIQHLAEKSGRNDENFGLLNKRAIFHNLHVLRPQYHGNYNKFYVNFLAKRSRMHSYDPIFASIGFCCLHFEKAYI